MSSRTKKHYSNALILIVGIFLIVMALFMISGGDK